MKQNILDMKQNVLDMKQNILGDGTESINYPNLTWPRVGNPIWGPARESQLIIAFGGRLFFQVNLKNITGWEEIMLFCRESYSPAIPPRLMKAYLLITFPWQVIRKVIPGASGPP